MTRVLFFLHPRALITSVTMPAEMIRFADHLERVERRAPSSLELRIASLDGQPVPAFERMFVEPDSAMADVRAEDIDLIFVPSLFRNPLRVVNACRSMFPTLERMVASGTTLCYSGTGSCFSAQAGLLDGRPATTHWYFMDEFAEAFPAVDLKRDHLITRAEEQYCAGSLNALADLTIHFIERSYGPRIARGVASQFSPEIRQPYRLQGFVEGESNPHRDELMVDAQQC